MNLRPITGSAFHRTERCVASSVLPQDEDDHEEARTEPARNQGTVVHRFLERVKLVGADAALLEVPEGELRMICQCLDLSDLPTHLATEVALCWNWKRRTARELGRNLGHRDYDRLSEPPNWDEEIPMTLDLMGCAMADHVGYVGDYKRGHTVYPRPGAFGQTMLGGLAAREVLQCDDMVLEFLYLHSDGSHHTVRDRVSGWDFDAYADRVQQVMESRPPLQALVSIGQSIASHRGDHCTYCRSYKHCSSTVALVKQLPEELRQLGVVPSASEPGHLDLAPNAITAARAGQMFLAAEAIEEVIGRIKSEICKLGYHTPIELPDGRVIEPHETMRRDLDGAIAARVLEQRYGREAAESALDISITFDAIKKVVAAHLDPTAKPKQTITGRHGQFELVVEEIDRRGGITKKASTVCRPRQPRRLKK